MFPAHKTIDRVRTPMYYSNIVNSRVTSMRTRTVFILFSMMLLSACSRTPDSHVRVSNRDSWRDESPEDAEK